MEDREDRENREYSENSENPENPENIILILSFSIIHHLIILNWY